MSFIVLEGLDGAGKSTQIKLLRQWLEAQGRTVEYIHFPRFDTPVYGELIARFLRGELGGVEQVNPYLTALIYAGDRAEAAMVIRRWLREGKTIIIDRYVASNIAYQCAKVREAKEKMALRKWILELEYDHHAIPRPDITLFLDVPEAFTEQSLAAARSGDDRDYLQGKTDIHEASIALQRAVRQVYVDEAAMDPAMRIIVCSDSEGGMLPPEKTFAKIVELLGNIR